MNDLFKKLNVLLKARVSRVLSIPTIRSDGANPLNRKPARDVEVLHQRINEAIDYGTKLQKQVEALQDAITKLDTEADDAVKAGHEIQARHFIEQIKRSERQLALAEADLQAQQRGVQDLIQRVNLLEATIADAHQAGHSPQHEGITTTLSTIIQEARQRTEAIRGRLTQDTSEDIVNDKAAIESDLVSRINRLSKR